MTDEDIQNQLEKLQRRIKYDVEIFLTKQNYENILKDLLEDSLNIALAILYPFDDFSGISLPKKYYNWQIRA